MSIKKESFRSGPYKDLIAQGVKVGNVLYLSGQVGMNEEDGSIPDGIVDQTKQTYANIKAVLKEFGASMDNIVDETVFVTNPAEVMEQIEGVFGARAEAYGGMPEVCQTMVQAALLLPELKIEIKCVAHL